MSKNLRGKQVSRIDLLKYIQEISETTNIIYAVKASWEGLPKITNIEPPKGYGNFELSEQEIKSLIEFFYHIGYISHEHHASIHVIIKRMEDFLAENK